MEDFFLNSFSSSPITHEVIGLFMVMTTIVSWLLVWFILRAEHILHDGWWPPRRNLPWALSSKLIFEGLLEVAIGLLVMFGQSIIPYWGMLIVVGLFCSSMFLFKVYAEVEVQS